jgi:hypothetical protein
MAASINRTRHYFRTGKSTDVPAAADALAGFVYSVNDDLIGKTFYWTSDGTPRGRRRVSYTRGDGHIYSGTTTLVNGVSPNIATPLTATSTITLGRKGVALSTKLGNLTTTTRTAAVWPANGVLIISSLKDTDATVETGDQSLVDWHLIDDSMP